MAMKEPPHPGESVRFDCIEPLGLSITGAAKALGVTRQALNNLVTCKAAISAEMAVRLDMAFGGSAEAWLALQSAYDLAQARKRVDAASVPGFTSALLSPDAKSSRHRRPHARAATGH